ncbi:WD repeat-containing protein 55 homolog [Ctenocephalides felis]|uniref:WD repeat-containing protein 55 homolog n=1 Tax=Ctenocephalides felis TaxID=7515 RepID=UPI000E6E2531|nr:WD repeat-containing protein 55 homolog [Ctenocephalides felis]
MSDSSSEDDEILQENDAESSDSDSENNLQNQEEYEDELIKAIKEAQQFQRNHPPDINTEEFNADICFHPKNDLLGVANMLGDIQIYKYSTDANELIATHECHLKSCRDIEFSDDGNILYSTAKDKSIVLTDVESGKFIRNYEEAHEVPAYCLTIIDENIFATGDDDGCVKIWDLRVKEQDPLFSLKKCEDYISDMITNDHKKYLVCSSGDGSLTTININMRKIHVQSEEYEEELTCLGLYNYETKIVAGSSKGRLYSFNWNEFGLHCDSLPGPKRLISCLIPVTENIVVSSGEDGILRATHLSPQRHLGVVGQHNLFVESMDISNDGTIIASSSHNNDIKFWNIQYFEDYEKANTKEKHNKKKEMKKNLPSSKMKDASDFFAGFAA